MSIKDYLESYACTSVGCVRENNEDAALMMREHHIFVVADGMGGGNAGELASLMTITEIEKRVLKIKKWSLAKLESAIIRSAYSVNTQIKEYARKRKYERMGTTMTCLLFNPWHHAHALALHSGDSRIYRFRNGKLQQQTKDHSLNPNSNVITNAVGIGHGFYLDITSIDVQAGDWFIICSDGLSHMVPDREIKIICGNGIECDSESLCKKLVNRALEKGGKDNVTVIVIHVNDLPADYEPSDLELEEENKIQQQNACDLSETPPTIH